MDILRDVLQVKAPGPASLRKKALLALCASEWP